MLSKILVEGKSEWFIRILNQEGIRSGYLDSKSPEPHQNSVIWANFHTLDFLRERPSSKPIPKVVFTSHRALSQLLSVKMRHSKATYFSFGEGLSRTLLDTRVQALDVAGLNASEQFGLHIDKYGKKIPGSGIFQVQVGEVTIFSFPWNFDKVPERNRRIPTYLRRELENGSSIEEISTGIDSAAVRRSVFFVIEKAHSMSGQKLQRLSAIPKGGPYIIVRIDADGYSKTSTDLVCGVSEKHQVPFSWFIDVFAWKDNAREIERIAANSEIGAHCFFHLTFQSKRSNLQNFQMARRFLSQHLGNESGAVSPHGCWNPGYARAISDSSFCYSSEFAASEPDLPFWISYSSSKSILQIPTPPWSLGSWKGPGTYWDFVKGKVNDHIADFGIAIIYDHPLGRLEHEIEGFERLIGWAKDKGIKFITMRDWFEIWSSRENELSQQPKTNHRSSHLARPEIEFEVESSINFDSDYSLSRYQLLSEKSDDIISSSWRIRKSFFLFLIGLVPLKLHLEWQRLRAKLIKSDQN